MFSFNFKIPDNQYDDSTLEVYFKNRRISKIAVSWRYGGIDLGELNKIIETIRGGSQVSKQITCITYRSGDDFGEELAIELRPNSEFVLTGGPNMELVLPLDECDTNSLLLALNKINDYITASYTALYAVHRWH